MKRWLALGCIVACFLVFPVAGNAESASQEVGVGVADGGILVEVPKKLSLAFEGIEFEKLKGRKDVYPVLSPYDYTYTVNPRWGAISFNPFGEPWEIIDTNPPDSFGNPTRDAIVKVTNKNYSSPEFKVTVQRSGFFHKETGEEMTGVHLYMGKFTDIKDYEGANRTATDNYDPTAIAGKDSYWLAKYLTIEEGVASLVADYRGKSGLGERFLSPFTPENREKNGTITIDDDYEKKYTEKNIMMGIDYRTEIPSSGTFATTLTWSVEQTP